MGGLLGMLGIVQATAAHMQSGRGGGPSGRSPPPAQMDHHAGVQVPIPTKAGAMLNSSRMRFTPPTLDDVDLDLAAEQHHRRELAFDPLR